MNPKFPRRDKGIFIGNARDGTGTDYDIYLLGASAAMVGERVDYDFTIKFLRDYVDPIPDGWVMQVIALLDAHEADPSISPLSK